MWLPSSAAQFSCMANILMAFVPLLHMNKCRIHVVYVELLSVSLLVKSKKKNLVVMFDRPC